MIHSEEEGTEDQDQDNERNADAGCFFELSDFLELKYFDKEDAGHKSNHCAELFIDAFRRLGQPLQLLPGLGGGCVSAAGVSGAFSSAASSFGWYLQRLQEQALCVHRLGAAESVPAASVSFCA